MLFQWHSDHLNKQRLDAKFIIKGRREKKRAGAAWIHQIVEQEGTLVEWTELEADRRSCARGPGDKIPELEGAFNRERS